MKYIRLHTARLLLEYDIPVTLVADSLVAHIMAQVDLVLVGAVAVVENGGLLNKVESLFFE